jgi:hypothetical protein
MRQEGLQSRTPAGDSRGVLARRMGGELRAVQMTVDASPRDAREAARIAAAGGEVRLAHAGPDGEGGTPRIYAKGRNYPGAHAS